MEIVVLGRSQAIQAAPSWKPTHILSIRSPDEPHALFDRPSRLEVMMHNIDRAYGEPWLEPTAQHARDIVHFGRAASGGRLLIHSHAGMARSSAACLGILADRLQDPEEAVRRLLEIRPSARPNPLLCKLLGTAIGMGSALEAAAKAIKGS